VASKRVDFAYNALGQFTDLDRYASLDTSEFVANTAFTYDLANRLTSLQHTQGLTALAGYDYTYDAAGRFTSIDSLLDGLTEYTHDNAGQLTDADHASITDEAYEYDDNGNRVMSGYVVGANNRISTDGVFDFEYDDEGNMVAKEEISSGERTEYEWDHRNRLVRIVSKDEFDAVTQVVEQTYDYQNRWVRSQIDADGDEDFDSERFFAYDGNQIVLEFAGDAASDLSHRYLWGPAVDQILADESVDSLTSAGDVLWPLTDHLNTTRDLAEYNSGTNTASIASHRVFDSFGNLISESNGSVTILLGFTARPFDVASGLQWNLNRWYISTLGVWMSEDPIGFAAGDTNVARYAKNQPVSRIDPPGLADQQAWDEYQSSMSQFNADIATYNQQLLDYYRSIMKEMIRVGDAISEGGIAGLRKLGGLYDRDWGKCSKVESVSIKTCKTCRELSWEIVGTSEATTFWFPPPQHWRKLRSAITHFLEWYDNMGPLSISLTFAPNSSSYNVWFVPGIAISQQVFYDMSPQYPVTELIHEGLHDLVMYGIGHSGGLNDVVPTVVESTLPKGPHITKFFDFVQNVKTCDGVSIWTMIQQTAGAHPGQKPIEPTRPEGLPLPDINVF
jgi:RHS repeat-associated protein